MTTTTPIHLPELDEYDVLAPIAKGGMAAVYLARRRKAKNGRDSDGPTSAAGAAPLALKIMRPDLCRNAEFVAMFLDEARIASHLAHPNIAAIHGLGHDRHHYFLAMELLRGRTLLDVIDTALKKKKRMPYELVAWIGARIASALHHAHELRDDAGNPQQVVHRDVNPSNIFITFAGVPKLIDFGLAKARDRIATTAHGILKGKLAYLAPEQIKGGGVDRRADIFALGTTLWEVSVGDRLFRASNDAETLKRITTGQVPDPRERAADYPPALAEIIKRALALKPEDRYRTALELADALDRFVASGTTAVDEIAVAAFVRELFPSEKTPQWERMADEIAPTSRREEPLAGGALMRAWDDEEKKMTWMSVDSSDSQGKNGGVRSLHGGGSTDERRPPRPSLVSLPDPPTIEELRAELEASIAERLEILGPKEESQRARALLEGALVQEWFGSAAGARVAAEEAARLAPGPASFAIWRRTVHDVSDPRAVIGVLDAELPRVVEAGIRADLFAERGRAEEAAGELAAARKSFTEALELVPEHAAALKGLEGVLRRLPDARADLAAHLARMADAYVEEPALAAFIHVERARILDRELQRVTDARAAFARAVDLDHGIGPVRDAALAFAVEHRDAPAQVALLVAEMELEPDADRSATLGWEAAVTARLCLADAKRAVHMLEKALARRPSSSLLRRLILDDLVSLHERAGRSSAALEARRARLALMTDPVERAVELRAIAIHEERADSPEHAAASMEEAYRLVPHDRAVREELDRLLERAYRAGDRLTLWKHTAGFAGDPAERAAAALRAAGLAEALGEQAQAIELHRMALASAPGEMASIDALDRLLRAAAGTENIESARARIALHLHGFEHATDAERRIAHLEVVALLEEESLGAPAVALATYERILAIAPGRRSALVGIARTARRAGDGARAASALLAEAELVPASPVRDDLLVRAAAALAETDTERALALTAEVLARVPARADARAVRRTIYERAQAWVDVEREVADTAAHAPTDSERVDWLLALAEVQRGRIVERHRALATIHRALSLAPRDPRAVALALNILEEIEDPKTVRDGLVALAEAGLEGEAKARLLFRASTVSEHLLEDDTAAFAQLEAALTLASPVPAMRERFERLALRRERGGENGLFTRVMQERVQRGEPRATFAVALHALSTDPRAAGELGEKLFAAGEGGAHVLSLLDAAASATDNAPLLANVLAAKSQAFVAVRPKLGVAWRELALVQWKLDGQVLPLAHAIVTLAPTDRAALDTLVRTSLAAVRAGDETVLPALASTLQLLIGQATDDWSRLLARLALALTLVRRVGTTGVIGRDVLHEMREALRLDARSVIAATAAARLGPGLNDSEATVMGTLALADVETNMRRRAALLTRAAGAIIGAPEKQLGIRADRLARAADLLETALAADPEEMLAVSMLVAVRTEEGERDRLLSTLGKTFDRARSRDVIAALGIELATVAREKPETRSMAIDALKRVVAVAPGDAAAWRLMASVYLDQGSVADAARALEAVAANAREPRDKIDALFGLVELYKKSSAPADVERVLRVVLDVDPMNARALRAMIAYSRERAGSKENILSLLGRLVEAAPRGNEKAAALEELGAEKLAAGDRAGAQNSYVEAAAEAPANARLARVVELGGGDPVEQARLLSAVVARGEQLGRPDAAAWAMLGQIEVDHLARLEEGVAHLRRALVLEPARPESKAALARGLAAVGKRDEAATLITGMLTPDAAPLLSLRDPGGALGTLESSLFAQGRRDESLVVRELRALAGAIDDGAHVELRSRRRGALGGEAERLDEGRLLSLMPDGGRGIPLTIVGAIASVAAQIVDTNLEPLGIAARRRPAPPPALAATVGWLSSLLEVDPPEVVASERIAAPRVACVDGKVWVVVPSGLAVRPEPEQVAAVARVMVRIALRMPWLDDTNVREAHALLCAAVQRVQSDYGLEANDLDIALVQRFGQKLARVVGRREKKTLSEILPQIEGRAIASHDIEALFRAVARLELRVAFIVTGDLLATLDALRATDAGLMRDLDAVGPRALAAAVSHPLAADVTRFAMTSAATTARTRLGTLWAGGRR